MNNETEANYKLGYGSVAARPEPIMQYFEYAHLPAHLQAVSKPIGDLAKSMVETLPQCAERTAGLRKLLESKDCLVRAALAKEVAVSTLETHA